MKQNEAGWRTDEEHDRQRDGRSGEGGETVSTNIASNGLVHQALARGGVCSLFAAVAQVRAQRGLEDVGLCHLTFSRKRRSARARCCRAEPGRQRINSALSSKV